MDQAENRRKQGKGGSCAPPIPIAWQRQGWGREVSSPRPHENTQGKQVQVKLKHEVRVKVKFIVGFRIQCSGTVQCGLLALAYLPPTSFPVPCPP